MLIDAEVLAQAESLVDMRAPLMPQIRLLNKRQYLLWTHMPYHYTDAPKHARLFKSDFWEGLSKTVWWVVPAVWIPVCVALWLPFLTAPFATVSEGLLLLAAGIFIWTFVEYTLHRFVFHFDGRLPDHPEKPWSQMILTLHFLFHGVHHRTPLDRYRLVMPPALLAVFASIVYVVFRCLIPIESGIITHQAWHALYGSGLLGYIMYDMFHYAQHHASADPETYVGRMKRYHMKHHFADVASDLGFGVTSKLWDHVFGTVLPLPDLPSRNTVSCQCAASEPVGKPGGVTGCRHDGAANAPLAASPASRGGAHGGDATKEE